MAIIATDKLSVPEIADSLVHGDNLVICQDENQLSELYWAIFKRVTVGRLDSRKIHCNVGTVDFHIRGEVPGNCYDLILAPADMLCHELVALLR